MLEIDRAQKTTYKSRDTVVFMRRIKEETRKFPSGKCTNSSDVGLVFVASSFLRVAEEVRIIRLGRVSVKFVTVERGILWIERVGASFRSEGVFDGIGLRSRNISDEVDVAKMPSGFEWRVHGVRRYPSRLRSVDVLSMERKERSLMWFETLFGHGPNHIVGDGHAVYFVYGSQWIGGSFRLEADVVDVLNVVKVDWRSVAPD